MHAATRHTRSNMASSRTILPIRSKINGCWYEASSAGGTGTAYGSSCGWPFVPNSPCPTCSAYVLAYGLSLLRYTISPDGSTATCGSGSPFSSARGGEVELAAGAAAGGGAGSWRCCCPPSPSSANRECCGLTILLRRLRSRRRSPAGGRSTNDGDLSSLCVSCHAQCRQLQT